MRKIGKYKWGSEGEAEELAGGFDDVVGVVVAQLGDGAETPADSGRLDAGAAGGIHVDARIADIKHLGFRGGAFAENFKHDRGVGFYGDPLFLPFDCRPGYLGEVVVYEVLDGCLIFV